MEKVFKKMWLLPLFICTIMSCGALTSCGDDDEDEPDSSSNATIVGVWRLDFEDGYQLLTFEKNGKYTLVEFDFASGNWSEKGTYSINGNVLTMLSDGEVSVYTILTHTATKLILRYEGEYVGQRPNKYDEDVKDWTRME